MKENSVPERAKASALAAEDDARIRRRTFAIVVLVFGLAFVGGSLLLWPRGIFQVVTKGVSTEVLTLVTIGVASLLIGAVLITAAIRRLARLRNNLVSVGKANSAFVNEPDFQMPSIGIGHGGPLDVSAAKFANPGKLLPRREP